MTLSDINSGAALHKLLQNRWLIWLVNILLALWLVWLVVDAALPWFRPATEPEPVTKSPLVTIAPHQESLTGQIANWHLFGIANKEAASEKTSVINAPETKLELTLRGIVAENDRHKGYAIIQKPDHKEKHFAINDSIFDLATLEEIYVDRVIILRKGQYETLTLPKVSLNLGNIISDALQRKRGKLIDDYRGAVLSGDAEKFVGVVDIDEFYTEEGFYGFQLLAESERGKHLLSELGLEHEDVVIEINGKVLAEDLEAASKLGELKTATEVSIVVDRNGAKIPYHINIPQDQ